METTTARAQDLELARRASGGDRAAQRALFVALRGNVHRALFRILGSNRELEDLLQDTFVEIFRSLGSYRGDSTLARWCQVIAIRIAYLAIARRRPPAVELALVEDELPADGDLRRTIVARDAVRRLYTALDRVPAKHRIAFALAVIDGRSLAEVAELTGATVFATKTRVWRARRQLEQLARKDELLTTYLCELRGDAKGDPR